MLTTLIACTFGEFIKHSFKFFQEMSDTRLDNYRFVPKLKVSLPPFFLVEITHLPSNTRRDFKVFFKE